MARKLRDWLTSYMQYTAKQEAPDAFHFWTGVSTIAGALRRKVYFDQIYFRWSPSFYIILVSPPGVSTKSVAMSIGIDILKEIPGVNIGANALTWQSLASELANSAEAIEVEPGVYETHCCLTFCASELGSLLDPQDRKMLDVLVDLWDGRSWKKTTKTSGKDDIPNPWVNILAGTTPIWLADNLPRTIVGGGFTSRCIFVYAEDKRNLIAYPRYQLDVDSTRKLREDLVHDLEQISLMIGEFLMEPEAIEWGTDWYERNHREPSSYISGDPQFSGYINRKQNHAHKLAMVISASHTDRLVITKRDLEAAVRILDSLECGLPNVFKAINTTVEQSKMIDIVEKVRATGTILEGALYRLFVNKMGIKEYQEAISSALAAKLIIREQRGAGIYITPNKEEK